MKRISAREGKEKESKGREGKGREGEGRGGKEREDILCKHPLAKLWRNSAGAGR
jgi:hypothetical protein